MIMLEVTNVEIYILDYQADDGKIAWAIVTLNNALRLKSIGIYPTSTEPGFRLTWPHIPGHKEKTVYDFIDQEVFLDVKETVIDKVYEKYASKRY